MRRGVVRVVAGAAIVVAVALASGPAKADLCVRPDLIDAFPPDGAENVPTNAVLTAHYAPTAEYVDENVTLHGPDPGGSDITVGFRSEDTECVDPLPGSFCFNRAEGLINLRPPADLEPGRGYTVEWPGLRGVGTASRGDGRTVTFAVGEGPDLLAPRFEGLTKVSWDLDRERDQCTEGEQDRFYFDLALSHVSDDFGVDLLSLRVFQTKGPTLAPGKRDKVALVPIPAEGDTVRVELSVSDATGDVCFAAQVEDLKPPCHDDTCEDRFSAGADKEVCAATKAPPFFYGCGVSRSRNGVGDRSPLARASMALFLLLAARRRHRPVS
jgi:hypothetical protein